MALPSKWESVTRAVKNKSTKRFSLTLALLSGSLLSLFKVTPSCLTVGERRTSTSDRSRESQGQRADREREEGGMEGRGKDCSSHRRYSRETGEGGGRWLSQSRSAAANSNNKRNEIRYRAEESTGVLETDSAKEELAKPGLVPLFPRRFLKRRKHVLQSEQLVAIWRHY